MSQVVGTHGPAHTGGETFPPGEATPAVRARAQRAQKLVLVVMLALMALPVAMWLWMNS